MSCLAQIQGHLGFVADNERQTLICIVGVSCLLPVERLLAAEVTEAGVSTELQENPAVLFFSGEKGQNPSIISHYG